MNYGLKVNPHEFRVGMIQNLNPVEDYYRMMQRYFGIVNTEDELKKYIKEVTKRNMGQKTNPHSLRVGVIKDWDSKWYQENAEDDLYISKDLIHHSLDNRKIHLIKLLGKKRYRKTVSKVKTLSR